MELKQEIENVKNWIRTYVANAGKSSVVLGLSGGVDSSVVAALATDALGADSVFFVNLPCQSNPADLRDANFIADFLDVDLDVNDLTTAYNVLMMTLGFDPDQGDLVAANMKARLRMVTLYAKANDMDSLVIGTTNRSEFLIGYFTKFGDGAVDFEPLGEFWKSEVIAMGMELGLPEALCNRTPTASLQEGVTDESEIGMPYSELDPILHGLINKNCIKLNDPKILRASNLMQGTHHKRVAPPVFKRKK